MTDTLSALARDHIERPRNRGRLPREVAGRILRGEAGSAASGAFVCFRMQVEDGLIRAVRYRLLGPPELIAAVSFLSEKLSGRRAAVGSVPRGLALARALELPRAAHGLALLAEDAARACLDV